jgi:hypothetical protein
MSLPRLCAALAAGGAELEPQLARLSALQGATHIWPHCGPTNARIRLHVPLAVPPGDYTLTVAGELAWGDTAILHSHWLSLADIP